MMMLRPALLLGLIAVLGLASPADAQVLKGGVQENVGGPAPSPSPAPGLPQTSIPTGVSLYPGEFLTGGGAQCDATLKQVAQRGGWCMAQGVPGNEYCRCYDPARVPAPSSPLQSGVQGNGPGGTGNPPLGGGVNGGPGGSFGFPPGTNGGPPTGANTGTPAQPGYPGQGYPAPANSAPSASGPHRVGSTWSCRACDPDLCYKQSAEITACRPAATAGNPPPGFAPGGVLKRYPPDRVICQAGGGQPITGGVKVDVEGNCPPGSNPSASNAPPSPTRATPPDLGPMPTPALAPPTAGTIQKPASPTLNGGAEETGQQPPPKKSSPFQIGADKNVPHESNPPPPSYTYPYPSPAPPATTAKPAPNPPAANRLKRPTYANGVITYRLNGQAGRQQFCITRNDDTVRGQQWVDLPAVNGTQFRYYVQAVGIAGPNSIRLIQLIDFNGVSHPFNLTVPFTSTPCRL